MIAARAVSTVPGGSFLGDVTRAQVSLRRGRQSWGTLVERLCSPWRLKYVTGTGAPCACVFCDAQTHTGDDSLVVYRGQHAFAILNLFPYNSGHLLIVPNRHIAKLSLASPDELCELMDLTRVAEEALTEVYAPQGLNVGMNLGRAAGAGIADHLHLHIVPRWNGDTNFMTVVGDVRVLPEDLPQAAARLAPVFTRIATASRSRLAG